MNREKLIKLLRKDIEIKENELKNVTKLIKREIDQMKLQLESLEHKGED